MSIIEELKSLGKTFWWCVAIFSGLNTITTYTNFAKIVVESPLKEIIFFGKLISFLIIIYILVEKIGTEEK